METQEKTSVTIETTVNAPVQKAWDYFNKPEHITQWAYAIYTWHCPRATNDLRKGGKFTSRMEAKDGSMGFDFEGKYDEVREHEYIAYTMPDGRKVEVKFIPQGNATRVVETFDAESENPVEMQRTGWQAILDNYKNHTENN